MKKEKENEKSKVAKEPVVIPDECGDSMWDKVLEQSPFVQALKKANEEKIATPKDKGPSTD